MQNISLGEYFSLKDTSEYDIYASIIKPKNELCGNVFSHNKLTFNEFHTIISIFNESNSSELLDLFIHLYRIKGSFEISAKQQLLNESVFQFFRALRHVKLFMESKLKLEEKLLYSEPDTKMLEINAYKRMQPFSTMLTKIKLAEQFGQTPEEIGNWKYTQVINILASNNIVSQINKEYNGGHS